MKSEFQFGLASEADACEILSLYHGNIGSPGCTWSLEYPCMENIAEDIGKSSLYCLRDKEHRIVAAAAAGEYDELDDDGIAWDAAMRHPCDLARIGVLPGLKGRGLGLLILENLIQDVKRRRFDGIRMLVSKTNPAALALYHKTGFSCCGEIYKYDIDFFCYERIIKS